MKKKIFLIVTCFLIQNLYSQTSLISIDFDSYQSASDNDYQNYFFDGTGFTNNTTDGITGGALNCPNTAFLDQQFTYSNYLKNYIGANYKASICFKYNSTLINPNDFQRAVGINFEYPEYIYFALDKDKVLNITSYNWVASNTGDEGHPVLIDNNWYKLEASINVIGGTFNDQLFVKAEIFNLGSDGLATPTSVSVADGNIYYSNYTASSKVKISSWGTVWGGSSLLDNFQAEGEFVDFNGYTFNINGPYNAGSNISIYMSYDNIPKHNSINKYIIQLSDNLGSFDAPVNIDTIAGIGGGNISCKLPSNLITGSQYKLRSISSNPIDTSEVSQSFIINAINTTSIENNERETYKLYPNPTTGKFYIECAEKIISTYITNITGEFVDQKQFNDNKIEIDFSVLPQGVYFLKVETLQNSFMKKLVKN